MFKHSIKVPRLYKVAAKVAKEADEGIGSIKHLVYQHKSKHPNIKAIYALVANVFKRKVEIENILKRSQIIIKEPRLDPWLTKILIVELLWGKKCLPGNSKPETTILAYEQVFKAHLSDAPLSVEENNLDSSEEFKPRYVRVNTLSLTVEEAIDGFRDEGWVLSKFFDKTDYQGFLDKLSSLDKQEFLVDIHIPNLLIFPRKTEFYNHPAYKNGSIILQDKASCLPVHILAPPPGSIVLDMCAAPGMKTTQVAAMMSNKGKIFAVERNPFRFKTLNKIVASSGATCITTVNKDVLTATEKDFPGVEYILVDPSCSGSGIVGRLGFEQEKSNERLENLAGFQIKILRSALVKFPNAKRVVYSTCSIFPEENEDVVRQVLETNSSFKLVPAKQYVNATWKNFGSSEYGDIGAYCLYAKPGEDFTNGFFVAVFERLEEGEENQFFNSKIYNFKKHVQSQENRKRKQQQQHQQIDQGGSDQNYEQDKYKTGNDGSDTKMMERETNTKKKKRKKNEEVPEVKTTSEANKNYELIIESFEPGEEKKTNMKKSKEVPDITETSNVEDKSRELIPESSKYGKEKKKKNKKVPEIIKTISGEDKNNALITGDYEPGIEKNTKKKKNKIIVENSDLIAKVSEDISVDSRVGKEVKKKKIE